MKQLVVLGNARMAQAFIDYLATIHIECKLAPAGDGVAIWLVNDEQYQQADAELQQFMQNPNDQRYHAASWQTGDHSKVRFRYGGQNSFISNIVAHAGPVTLSVLVAAVAIYVLMNIGFQNLLFNNLRITDTLEQLLSLEFWRAITPIFLHFSIVHIAFNCLWWWQLGGEIEQRLGSQKLLLVTLVAAVIPNVAQLLAAGPLFGGLSGVVYALLGYIWFTGWLNPRVGLSVSPSIVGFMLLWLVFGFMNVIGPPMANLAHLFGLLVGCGQALIDKATDKGTS
ncbi:rhomboid family intramembrane serine protease GlpG [Aliagarivorans taiwanensis]|uniref:rhomboid family intramembrane serine protease GlpG n=1 Tax=Aliagarivorans taiwanensis TaxID=561966 RepID=UPI00041B35BB|nr:rhomboid family intramembrane serine protease GlpG [Aliagarivorans taiwanensis]